ncbi:hypothetical protein CAPTEDRAFT_21776 [Capitella teleta]|uniref:Succinate dehydrogenase [ubiquinone] cytochrome b small subunit n=1 Tax=Capitella teleta TaxID=283909 RepID=R7U338_CAPTE|nr:hypothetical protein CAPTEDRAFT_21776 [Capitella teleta]|eukprot:ELU00511.1 hypothetical protein CAPTEDRAFT_21776 [Capitella teleta]
MTLLLRKASSGFGSVTLKLGHALPPRACTPFTQSKHLALTSAQQGRIYGPEADHEKQVATRHWVNERVVAVALLPVIPIALAFPNPALDNLLITSVVLHTHWRLSGVVGDYVHGPIMPKICKPIVAVISACALGALLYFNYTDIGFANAVRMIYTEL